MASLLGPADQPMSSWPWNRCPAYSHPNGGACDLRRNHIGPHVAERGLGMDIVWTEVHQ